MAAELVYGTTLRLPAEFHAIFRNPPHVSTLKSCMQLQATPLQQAQRSVYISPALSTCSHVFIRHDAVRKPLHQSYDRPYKVLNREDKHFVVDINGHHDTVSLDRLKPSHREHPLATLDMPPCEETHPSSSLLALFPAHLRNRSLVRDVVSIGLITCMISFPSSSLGRE